MSRMTPRRRRAALALAWVASLAVATSGTAFAAAKITGAQIKDGTITSHDIKNGSIALGDLNAKTRSSLIASAVAKARNFDQPGSANAAGSGATGAAGVAGTAGAVGAKGDTGAKGDRGAQGEPGQSIVADVTTATDAASGTQLSFVPNYPSTGQAPDDTNKGKVLASVTLDKGDYIVSGTVQFLALFGSPEQDSGVATIFVGGVAGGKIYAGDLPNGAGPGANYNFAQGSATVHLTITADDTVVSLNGGSRGYVAKNVTPVYGPGAVDQGVLAGANLLVTRVTSELPAG